MVSQTSSHVLTFETGAPWRAESAMLTFMMKLFMRRLILPAMQSYGMKKLVPETPTRLAEGRKRLFTSGEILRSRLTVMPVTECLLPVMLKKTVWPLGILSNV